MSDLVAYETKLEAGYPVLLLKGELDISNRDEFMTAALETFADSREPALLDLSEVTYMDSSGINVIFTVSQRLSQRGRNLNLVIPAQSPLQRLVRLTGLDQVSKIFGALGEAVQAERSL